MIDSEETARAALQPILDAAHHALHEIQDCSVQGQKAFSDLMGRIEKNKGLVRNADLFLRQQQESLQEKFTREFSELLDKSKDRIETHEAKLTELIGKATIGPISSRYDAKAKSERYIGRWFLGFFYLALIGAISIGVVIVCYSWVQLSKDIAFWNTLKTVLMRFVACTPIYLPLFWLIAHFNSWAVQKNRLAEEYEHKKLVIESYVGLADQIDALSAKGVTSASDLVGKQIERTVDIICFDACATLDKVRIQTPVSGLAKEASRMMSSVSGLVKGNLRSEK